MSAPKTAGEVHAHDFEMRLAALMETTPVEARALEGFRTVLATWLQRFPDLVVQKVSLASRKDALIEAKCTWTGADPDPRTVEAVLREAWPGDLLPEGAAWNWASEEEVVAVRFAWIDDSGWMQGRVRVFPG